MAEDLSYNLIKIKNYSTILQLQTNNSAGINSFFNIFQIALTHDLSSNDMETFRALNIPSNLNVSPELLLRENKFVDFYNSVVIDYSIDDAYQMFKEILEIYPAILLRERRNKKIKKTDFIMLNDFEIEETERQQWVNYRIQLRNITSVLQNTEVVLNDDNSFNVEWPVIPNRSFLLTNNYYNYT